MSDARRAKTVRFGFELLRHLIPDSAESLQSGGGEHVERAQLASSGGAVWGRARGSHRCDLHGPEAW